jgi:hypothetical protein
LDSAGRSAFAGKISIIFGCSFPSFAVVTNGPLIALGRSDVTLKIEKTDKIRSAFLRSPFRLFFAQPAANENCQPIHRTLVFHLHGALSRNAMRGIFSGGVREVQPEATTAARFTENSVFVLQRIKS